MSVKKEESQLQIVEREFQLELKANPKALNALLQTTFHNFTPQLMQQAIFEGMMRGYKFQDFLQKDVYAIKYGDTYSLITSIDKARKIAMRSGLAGKNAPIYTFDEQKRTESCTVTVKRNSDGNIGEYSATVFFDEFYKPGKKWNDKYTPSMWDKMPKVMLAKVAEMHALRSAFPEEMAKQYIEEEMQKNVVQEEEDFSEFETKLKESKTSAELISVWASMPQKAKAQFKGLATELKANFNKMEIPVVEDDPKK